MRITLIRRSIFAALLAAAGSLALSCSLVEARAGDLAAASARLEPEAGLRRLSRRRAARAR